MRSLSSGLSFDHTPPSTVCRLTGVMDIHLPASALKTGKTMLDHDVHIFDLSGVTHADSTSLAMAFVWQAYARSRQRDLTFTGVPDTMLELARLYGIERWLSTSAT